MRSYENKWSSKYIGKGPCVNSKEVSWSESTSPFYEDAKKDEPLANETIESMLQRVKKMPIGSFVKLCCSGILLFAAGSIIISTCKDWKK